MYYEPEIVSSSANRKISMTTDYKSGMKAKYSGRYHCESCDAAKTLNKGKKIIACKCGGKNWKLVSYTGQIPDSDKNFFDRLFK